MTKDEGRGTKDDKTIRTVRGLGTYQLAFSAAMEIFNVSKTFPSEERFSLTDQIRRSSRSICTSLSEGWRKRRYHAHFVHQKLGSKLPSFIPRNQNRTGPKGPSFSRDKLTEAMQEAAETQTWLDFALACGYISPDQHTTLDEKYEHVFAMLSVMEKKVNSFCTQVRPSEHRSRSSFVLHPSEQ